MNKPHKHRSRVTLTTRADISPNSPRPRQPLRARLRLPLHGSRGKAPGSYEQQAAPSLSKATRNSSDVAHTAAAKREPAKSNKTRRAA